MIPSPMAASALGCNGNGFGKLDLNPLCFLVLVMCVAENSNRAVYAPAARVVRNTAVCALSALPSTNRTGLAQIAGQVHASDKDSQSKHWAKL
jgi:hypothetical protein